MIGCCDLCKEFQVNRIGTIRPLQVLAWLVFIGLSLLGFEHIIRQHGHPCWNANDRVLCFFRHVSQHKGKHLRIGRVLHRINNQTLPQCLNVCGRFVQLPCFFRLSGNDQSVSKLSEQQAIVANHHLCKSVLQTRVGGLVELRGTRRREECKRAVLGVAQCDVSLAIQHVVECLDCRFVKEAFQLQEGSLREQVGINHIPILDWADHLMQQVVVMVCRMNSCETWELLCSNQCNHKPVEVCDCREPLNRVNGGDCGINHAFFNDVAQGVECLGTVCARPSHNLTSRFCKSFDRLELFFTLYPAAVGCSDVDRVVIEVFKNLQVCAIVLWLIIIFVSVEYAFNFVFSNPVL